MMRSSDESPECENSKANYCVQSLKPVTFSSAWREALIGNRRVELPAYRNPEVAIIDCWSKKLYFVEDESRD